MPTNLGSFGFDSRPVMPPDRVHGIPPSAQRRRSPGFVSSRLEDLASFLK
jgi:hypothetical protein